MSTPRVLASLKSGAGSPTSAAGAGREPATIASTPMAPRNIWPIVRQDRVMRPPWFVVTSRRPAHPLFRGRELPGRLGHLADHLVLGVVGPDEAADRRAELLEGARVPRPHGDERILHGPAQARRQGLANHDRVVGNEP